MKGGALMVTFTIHMMDAQYSTLNGHFLSPTKALCTKICLASTSAVLLLLLASLLLFGWMSGIILVTSPSLRSPTNFPTTLLTIVDTTPNVVVDDAVFEQSIDFHFFLDDVNATLKFEEDENLKFANLSAVVEYELDEDPDKNGGDDDYSFWDKSKSLRENCESPANDIVSATCGSNYQLPRRVDPDPWRIVFFGHSLSQTLIKHLLACPSQCPYSPNCSLRFSVVSESDLLTAHVIVINQGDFHLIPRAKQVNPTAKIVLYWREAHHTYVPLEYQALVDFEMGVHLYAAIVTPNFMLPPLRLIQGGHNRVAPRKFALFVASDCQTRSNRQQYVEHLLQVLGPERVDRFGYCAHHPLPGVTIEAFSNLMRKYKFYFAFENSIQDGYTTEKLFHTLNHDVLPVYYGAMDVPNITTTPSFIRASDFSSPQRLAEYLLYLDTNPAAYEAYFTWKHTRPLLKAFEPRYLQLLSDSWLGPEETKRTKQVQRHFVDRAGACCRLCNRDFVMKPRKMHLVPPLMNSSMIHHVFYGK